jgi:hypothetical protein
VTLVSCTNHNSEVDSDLPRAALNGTYVYSSATSRQHVIISLQQCTFKNNSANYAVLTEIDPSESFAAIYSIDATLQ